MGDRRNFIKKSGVSLFGTILLTDPFVKSIATTLNLSPKELIKQFSHSCEIIRPEDFLVLKYYFINLKKSWRKLSKINEEKDAYMVVRIAQQHIGEEVQKSKNPSDPTQAWSFDKGCKITFPKKETDNFSKSYISGFSYLTFKLKEDQSSVAYSQESLTNWNLFDLLTIQDIEAYPADIPVILSSTEKSYPLSEFNVPAQLAIAQMDKLYIPLTIIEAPYKMYLSPITPALRPERDADYRYLFEKKNIINQYFFDKGLNKHRYRLSELWNNNLVFQETHPRNGVSRFPPNFKIVAVEETEENDTFLLPNPKNNDRTNLAKLTNLQEPNRDIRSKYFNISSLGLSSFLEYFNLDEKQLKVVGWKQDIKLGRDNYVEVTEKAIDSRSTLKLLVSDIAERRIEKGKSVLIYRKYFKYLEREKKFIEPIRFNNYLFKKIIALSEGSYFVPDSNFGDDNYFIPIHEFSKSILKMPYRGIDVNGKVIDFTMDLMIIRKFERKPKKKNDEETQVNKIYFTKENVRNALKKFNERVVDSKYKHLHRIYINNIKINYAPLSSKNVDDPSNSLNNGELITNEIQFYSAYNEDFEKEYPLIPNLKFAKIKVPQLEGIESIQKFYSVCFSKSYLKDGLSENNKTQVFLQIVDLDKNDYIPITGTEETDKDSDAKSLIDLIVDNQQRISSSITNIFSENSKNVVASVINPDPVINNLSLLEQGISLTDELNSRTENISLGNIRPADILRGMNTEILGGIDLKKILKSVIPLEDSPIFEIIDEAEEGFEALSEFKQDYEALKLKLKNLHSEIRNSESELKNYIHSELKTYVEKYFEVSEKKEQLNYLINTKLEESKLKIYEVVRDNEKKISSELNKKIKETTNLKLNEIKELVIKVETFFDKSVNTLNILLASKQILDVIQTLIDLKSENMVNQLGFDNIDRSLRDIGGLRDLKNEINILFKKEGSRIKKASRDFKKQLSDLFRESNFEANEKFQAIIKECIKLHLFIRSTENIEVKIDLTDDIARALKDLLGSNIIIKISGKQVTVKLNDNIDAFIEEIDKNADELSKTSKAFVMAFINAYNEVIATSSKFLESEKRKVLKEVDYLEKQINYEVKNKIDALWNDVIVKSELYKGLKNRYDFLQSTYLDFLSLKESAQELSNTLNIELEAVQDLINPKKDLKKLLSEHLEAFTKRTEIEQKTKKELEILVKNFSQINFDDINAYKQDFQKIEDHVIEQTNLLYFQVDAERQNLIKEINENKAEVKRIELELKNFLKNKLKELEGELIESNKELIDAYKKGEIAINRAQERIQILRDKINQLRAVNKKEVRYRWNTDKFENVSLGILEFIKGKQTPTKLEVDIKNTVHYDILSFPPTISGVTNETKTELSNFSIDFLKILTVEFDKVSFKAGSSVSEKFDVDIRDVRFAGPLNFVQVFQSYLKTIDKGLRFDVSALGVVLGYELCLPNIEGGAYNFVNWKLVMELRLSFKAGVPMRINLGLNTPQDMGLVTGAIWGGRGCFVLGLEPKRGIVSILLVIEVGAVLYLNLGVANGIVYIFAGIYIRKEYDKVHLRGYLTCGGALNIKNLIVASVTFYMGLRGNGKYVQGYCSITYKIKISSFIKIKVSMSMYKRLHGSPDNSQRSSSKLNGQNLELKENSKDNSNVDKNSNYNMDIDPNLINISNSEWDDFFGAYYK